MIEKDMYKNDDKIDYIKIATCLFAAVLLIIVIYGIIVLYSVKDHGTFGDMFGGLNTFFSGLAFSGIILTIFMQSSELKLQRKELEQTREILTLQKEEMSITNLTMNKQQFENTFFSILKLLEERLSKDSAKETVRLLYEDRSPSDGEILYPEKDEEKNNKNLLEFCHDGSEKLHKGLRTYFDTLIIACDFIDQNIKENTDFYYSLLVSTIPNRMTVATLYYSISDYGENIRDSVSKLNILINLSCEEFPRSEDKTYIVKFYDNYET